MLKRVLALAVVAVVMLTALATLTGFDYPRYIARPWLVPDARIVVDTVCSHASWSDVIVCDTLIVYTWTIEARDLHAATNGIKYRFHKASYATEGMAGGWTAWDYLERGFSYTWDCPPDTIEIKARKATGMTDTARCFYSVRLHREL